MHDDTMSISFPQGTAMINLRIGWRSAGSCPDALDDGLNGRLGGALSCLDGALRSRVIFGTATVAGAVMSPAFERGVYPLALMFVR